MDFTYMKNGESLAINPEKCTGCGICLEVCPHAVFTRSIGENEKRTPVKPAAAHRARCMECGACETNCPAGAISVNRGVGCAAAIIGSLFRGGSASCGCSCDPSDSRRPCC